jgi:hypothetical protein
LLQTFPWPSTHLNFSTLLEEKMGGWDVIKGRDKKSSFALKVTRIKVSLQRERNHDSCLCFLVLWVVMELREMRYRGDSEYGWVRTMWLISLGTSVRWRPNEHPAQSLHGGWCLEYHNSP